MKKDFSLVKVKSTIARLKEIKPDDEFGYEKAIRLYAEIGLPIRPVGKFAGSGTLPVFRVRVERKNIDISSSTQLGIPPPSIETGRCNPGYKARFYCSSDQETCFLEKVPGWVKENQLKKGDTFYVYFSNWLIANPFYLVNLVSPLESSWESEFEKNTGADYLNAIMSDSTKSSEEKEGIILLTDFVAKAIKERKESDPNVYIKTAAYLGYLFSIDYDLKGVFYQSVQNYGNGFNMAIHSSFYDEGHIVLLNAAREKYVLTDEEEMKYEILGNRQFSMLVGNDNTVYWPSPFH